MSQIVIGKAGNHNVSIDVDVLLGTRLLIQANSGGGKSWLLRRLAEQLYGKVPVIIIDPEGEFASLREKFDYFLVGEGGDTPAHERSASMLAETLLKLRANAVCDLYETFRKNPMGRHLWVKAFLGGLLDAPKSLWRPTVVIVDEAHMFCPEKGESPAEGVMVGLATAGRKRHFCPIWATQRLALLQKDGSSQLQNRMVGLTFEDVDVDRAAALLSVSKEESHEFKKQVKTIDPGNFFAFGRAISKERILVHVGPVTTSHEAETGKSSAMEPPPPPEKIKALLPKLADLPRTAEEKAKTEAGLRAEIRSLKIQMRSAPVQKLQPTAADPRAIERAVRETRAQSEKVIARVHADSKVLRAHGARLAKALGDLAIAAAKTFVGVDLDISKLKIPGGEIHKGETPAAVRTEPVGRQPPSYPRPDVKNNGDGQLTPYQQDILRGLAELEAIGRSEVPRGLAGAAAGKSHKSSTFERYTAALRSAGLIEYKGNKLAITDAGRGHVTDIDQSLSSDDVQDRLLRILTPYQRDIVKALVDVEGQPLSWDEIGEKIGKSAASSTFERYMASLKSSEIIEYDGPKRAKAAAWLFLE